MVWGLSEAFIHGPDVHQSHTCPADSPSWDRRLPLAVTDATACCGGNSISLLTGFRSVQLPAPTVQSCVLSHYTPHGPYSRSLTAVELDEDRCADLRCDPPPRAQMLSGGHETVCEEDDSRGPGPHWGFESFGLCYCNGILTARRIPHPTAKLWHYVPYCHTAVTLVSHYCHTPGIICGSWATPSRIEVQEMSQILTDLGLDLLW